LPTGSDGWTTSPGKHQQVYFQGNGWLICLYIPDNAPVRSKMLYASSKSTLSKELGDAKFIDYLVNL
jgi:hypothetical protein